ncbi:MAG: metalloregulator ArsR/SmtB family transcription factor [Myxococcota bacterium]
MSRRTDPVRAAPIFAALGDATRLAVLARLARGGPASIVELTLATEVTRQAVTKHLQVLAAAGLVRDHKAGRERTWELDARPIEEARRSLDNLSRHWDEALSRLKAQVEADP